MRRDNGSEDAASSHKVRDVHQEDGDGTLPLLSQRDRPLIIVLVPSYMVQLADCHARADRAYHAVESTNGETGEDQLEEDSVVVLKFL